MTIPFKRVCAVFFSPTGSTAKMTRFLAQQIAVEAGALCEEFDYTLPAGRKEPLRFTQEDLVVLGSPVYAGRTPNRMLSFLESISGEQTLAVLLATYGNRSYGDALTELRNVTENSGMIPVAASTIVSSHPMSRNIGEGTLGKGRPDDTDTERLTEFAGKIVTRLKGQGIPKGRLIVPGNDPVGPYYRPLGESGEPVSFLKAKPLTNDSCTDCGDCVRCCPEGAIDPKDPRIVSGVCIKCMACLEICKTHAKYFTDEKLFSHIRHLEETFSKEQKASEFYIV